jgi:hypothetical protein
MRDRKTTYVTREVPVDSSSNMLLGFVAGIMFGALGPAIRHIPSRHGCGN